MILCFREPKLKYKIPQHGTQNDNLPDSNFTTATDASYLLILAGPGR